MVTTNQKPVTDTQKIKRKEFNHNTKGNHHIQGKRARKDRRTTTKSPKTFNKRVVNTYLSTITLNVNELRSATIKNPG